MERLDPEFVDTHLADLLESDAVYFESDAERIPIDGGSIARMPGMEELASGCVVQRIDTLRVGTGAAKWLEAVEKRLAGFGCRRARLYLQESSPALESALAGRGYRPVDEVALVMPAGSAVAARSVSASVTLQPIRDAAGWEKKLGIQRLIGRGPDGHVSAAEKWVEFERRKSTDGFMTPCLILENGVPAGAVSVAVFRSIVRLKNLVVHPDFRRRGVGRRAAARWGELAVEHGKAASGCFAHAGGHALQMYRRAGFCPVSKQTEWVRELHPASRSGKNR